MAQCLKYHLGYTHPNKCSWVGVTTSFQIQPGAYASWGAAGDGSSTGSFASLIGDPAGCAPCHLYGRHSQGCASCHPYGKPSRGCAPCHPLRETQSGLCALTPLWETQPGLCVLPSFMGDPAGVVRLDTPMGDPAGVVHSLLHPWLMQALGSKPTEGSSLPVHLYAFELNKEVHFTKTTTTIM